MIFKNNGKLKIPLTEIPTNQHDQNATYMIATGIIPDDGTIIGDLYDADDNLVARKRVYSYEGGHKNIPFASLDAGKKGYLGGEKPDSKWLVDTIKLWLTDRQVKDDGGKALKDDPYGYEEKDTKAQLLEKVTPVKTETESVSK